jgi:CMP-N,N'-diacetyllegionaminic acid synthase
MERKQLVSTSSKIAIIPARGGSKGLPGKNLREIGGISLVRRAVQFCVASRHFDLIILTSDDRSILNEVSESEKIIRTLRPKKLASDNAPTEGAVVHALAKYKKSLTDNAIVVLVEPTAPFRSQATLDLCLKDMEVPSNDGVVTIVRCEDFLVELNGNQLVFGSQTQRRQEREGLYKVGGGFFLAKVNNILRGQRFLEGNVFGRVVNKIEGLDINDPDDFLIAEAVFNVRARCDK